MIGRGEEAIRVWVMDISETGNIGIVREWTWITAGSDHVGAVVIDIAWH